MAVLYLMTWREKGRRWVKKQDGKQHAVSCRQLRSAYPELIEGDTKRGSYRAANQWWQDKVIELEEAAKGEEPTFEELAGRKNLSEADLAKFNTELFKRLSKARPIVAAAGVPKTPELLSENQMRLVDAASALAMNNEIISPNIDRDRTISTLIDKWLSNRGKIARLYSERKSSNTKTPSLVTVAQNKAHLATLKDWIGESDTVEKINSAWLADFRDMLVEKVEDEELQSKSALNILGSVAMFIDWLAIEREVIIRPNLMNKRGWKLLNYDPQAYPMAVETWQKSLSKANDRTKLFMLLMANCGYTAKDIADINPKEVNWTKGRIKRQRSKGMGYKNAPVVDRILWRETFDLLKQIGRQDGERVLLSELGNPLVTDNRKDLVGENVKEAIQKAGFETGRHYRPKDIRSGCATLIDASEYDGWETYFLGQSPEGVAAKHYVGRNNDKQEQFDELTLWLRAKWFGES